MTLRSGAYGSVAEVVPYARYLLKGETTFNAVTRPTVTEVEGFFSRVSATLDMHLRAYGIKTPINTTNADTTAKIACDSWCVDQVAVLVEISHPGAGYNEEESNRTTTFLGLQKAAKDFAKQMAMGLRNNSASQIMRSGSGLSATNSLVETSRSDPDDTTKSQPKFRRGKFD